MDDLEAMFSDEWFADEDDLDGGSAQTFEVTTIFFEDVEDEPFPHDDGAS